MAPCCEGEGEELFTIRKALRKIGFKVTEEVEEKAERDINAREAI